MTSCPLSHDQPHRLVGAVHAASPDPVQEHQLGPEALGLAPGEAGQLGAADPVGEAEEVLDAGGVGGLAAWDVAIEDGGVETVGGRIDGGGQPRRAAADDDEVVVVAPRRVAMAPRVGDRLDRRVGVRLVAVDDDQQVALLQAELPEQLVRRARPGLEPLVRLGRSREEVAQPVVLGVHAPADQLHRRPCSHGATLVRAVGSRAWRARSSSSAVSTSARSGASPCPSSARSWRMPATTTSRPTSRAATSSSRPARAPSRRRARSRS